MSRALPVLLVLLLLLASSAPAAQHVPGVEQLLTTPVPSPVPGTWFSAASNGHDFAVVWMHRNSVYVTRLVPNATDGRTVRMHAGGPPKIAAIGTEYVVAWREGQTIFSGVLAEDGTIEERVVLGTVETGEDIAHLVANGSQVLLVVVHWNADRMRARLLGTDAHPDSDWMSLGAIESWRGTHGIDAAADPAGFLVTSVAGGTAVHGRRITSQGVTADFRIDLGERPANNLALVFDGSEYLLVLYRDPFTSDEGARGLLLTPDGEPRSAVFPIIQERLRVNTVVARAGGSLIFADDLVSGNAVVYPLDHATRTVGPPVVLDRQWVTSSVSNGRSALTLQYGYDGVFGRWLDGVDGTPASEAFPVSMGSQEQLHPAAALGTTVDLIVWEEFGRIRAARLARDGSVLDETPLLLSTPGARSVSPAVTFDGAQFVVVWCEEVEQNRVGRLLARRMTDDGSFVDAQPLVISDRWSETPAVAHTGNTTLITWVGFGTRHSTHGFGREVFGVRLLPGGMVLDSVPLLISRDPWDHYDPDVVAGDGAFLVGWQTFWWYGHHSPISTASSVALVSEGGTVTEPIVLEPLQLSGGISAPQVAWNGTEFLAAWNKSPGTRAVRITRSGMTGQAVTTHLPSMGEATFFEGSWHLVSDQALQSVYLSPDLRTELLLPGIADSDVQPAAASNGSRALIAYRRILHDPPHNGAGTIAYRLYDDPNACCPLPPPASRRRSVRK